MAHSALYTGHCTFRNVQQIWHIQHCTLGIAHSAIYNTCGPFSTVHWVAHILHCTTYMAHSALYIGYCTFGTIQHNKLYGTFGTVHWVVDIRHCTLGIAYSVLYSGHDIFRLFSRYGAFSPVHSAICSCFSFVNDSPTWLRPEELIKFVERQQQIK